MKLKQLLDQISYSLLSGNIDMDVTDIVYDSRKAEAGKAFLCISGAETDGHKYIQSAVERGSRVIFVEHEVEMLPDVTYIKLEDTRVGLALLSAVLFDYPAKRLCVIGITGTKGKTTTTFMIKSILEKAGKKVGIIGTLGVFMGDTYIPTHNTTPESYDIQFYFHQMAESGCDTVVMEVSSQALKLNRTAGITFDYAVYTNLSPDHIGGNEHKDLEEYIYCKSLLFKQCRQGIVNLDDEHAEDMRREAECSWLTYGFCKEADLRACQVSYVMEAGFIGIEFVAEGLAEGRFRVSIPGKFSAYNAMAAMCVGKLLGADRKQMADALKEVAVRGRVEPVNISDRFNLLIDYAHNAMSLESLLTTIKDYEPGRIVCLFGCGGNRSKLRRYEMGEISGKLSDLSVITADNSRFEDVMDIIEDIKTGIHKTTGEYVVIPDRKEAIRYCIENAKQGDIILLCGKGHEDYQEINGKRFPFDERVIIKEILEEIEWKG